MSVENEYNEIEIIQYIYIFNISYKINIFF